MPLFVVTKPILNVRSSPSDADKSNFIGQLLLGETIYLKDEPVIGTIPHGGQTDVWLGDEYNRFVARDGVRPRWEEYKEKLQESIRAFWQIAEGSGVNVALLDSGTSSVHQNLPATIRRYHGIFRGEITQAGEYEVTKGEINPQEHGTRMAGLICGTAAARMVGLAPLARLLDYKVVQQDETHMAQNLVKVLQMVSQRTDVAVINISLEFTGVHYYNVDQPAVNALLTRCIANGAIVVVASGNSVCGRDGETRPVFPAGEHTVISVGVLRDGIPINFTGCNDLSTLRAPDCFIELQNWTTCDFFSDRLQEYSLPYSSEAAAFFSGLVSLKKSRKSELNQSEVKDIITQTRIFKGIFKGMPLYELDVAKFLNH